jgi:hypothetical protein
MTDPTIERTVVSIREKCRAAAREEVSAAIVAVQNTAAEELRGLGPFTGKPLTVEDLCHAAYQPNSLQHPAIVSAIEQRAGVLVDQFVRDWLVEQKGAETAPDEPTRAGARRA